MINPHTHKVQLSKSTDIHNLIYCVIKATSCSSSTLEEQEDLEGDETGRGLEWPGEAELNGGNYNLASNLPGTISWVSSLQLKLASVRPGSLQTVS